MSEEVALLDIKLSFWLRRIIGTVEEYDICKHHRTIREVFKKALHGESTVEVSPLIDGFHHCFHFENRCVCICDGISVLGTMYDARTDRVTFTLLEVLNHNLLYQLVLECDTLLSNEVINNLCIPNKSSDEMPSNVLSGETFKIYVESKLSFKTSYDVFIPLTTWAPRAFEMVQRRSKNNWPSKETITRMLRTGCHMEYFGSNEHDTHFRLNFDLAQRELLDSFSQGQRNVYVIMLCLRQQVFSSDTATVVTTQVIAHTLFWMIQNNEPRLFGEDNMILCLEIYISEMHRVLECGVCRHFFVKSHNLLDHVAQQELEIAKVTLHNLMNDGYKCIYRLAQFKHADFNDLETVPLESICKTDEECQVQLLTRFTHSMAYTGMFSLYVCIVRSN